jgi:hypothetical protein
MKRTALLLSTVLLSGLLAAPPARAAPAAGTAALSAATAAKPLTTAVAKVKASPAKYSGVCPTTVGFSAVVAAKGKGTVRYRWVRGNASKSVIKSFRVNGARKVTVKDRQTFDQSTSGWQAVEILGKKGLAAKARFHVACDGPAEVWDVANPLPAKPDEPLIAAADVDVTPATYTGTCPTTVTFTGTIQISRTPATVAYRWIDSATGEGRTETISFPAGGPRSRQVTLPLSVGSSTSGWKAIDVLTARGHDSGRAAYRVTCTGTPPPVDPPPVDPPPAGQKPTVKITQVHPGDYNGSCAQPVDHWADSEITLPAGPAQKVKYWWKLDDTQWKLEEVNFLASTYPRIASPTANWKFTSKDVGSHKIALILENGTRAERSFSFSCPGTEQVTVTFSSMSTPVYKGECDGVVTLRADAVVVADRDTDLRYRVIAGDEPGPVRTARLERGRGQTIGDMWHSRLNGSGTRTVMIEVIDQNRPRKYHAYTWTCVPKDPSPGPVRVAALWPQAYHGDCAEPLYMVANGRLAAAVGTEIGYRWLIDGQPRSAGTVTVGKSGWAELQTSWTRPSKSDGTVALEVLSHNKPIAQAAYPVTCDR